MVLQDLPSSVVAGAALDRTPVDEAPAVLFALALGNACCSCIKNFHRKLTILLHSQLVHVSADAMNPNP